jgi:hypothetical protein
MPGGPIAGAAAGALAVGAVLVLRPAPEARPEVVVKTVAAQVPVAVPAPVPALDAGAEAVAPPPPALKAVRARDAGFKPAPELAPEMGE